MVAKYFSSKMEISASYIYIKGVRFHAQIGVSEDERRVGNEYVVDLRIKYPFAKALETDDVDDTLNYAAVFNEVKIVMQKPANLLEYVAGQIGERLLERFPKIEAIDLMLTKKNPPMGANCDGAGIELHLINDKTHT